MSLHHLNRTQNTELGRLLIAVAKALGVAAVVALIFPPGGTPWPIVDLLAGVGLAILLAALGIRILGETDPDEIQQAGKTTRRKR